MRTTIAGLLVAVSLAGARPIAFATGPTTPPTSSWRVFHCVPSSQPHPVLGIPGHWTTGIGGCWVFVPSSARR